MKIRPFLQLERYIPKNASGIYLSAIKEIFLNLIDRSMLHIEIMKERYFPTRTAPVEQRAPVVLGVLGDNPKQAQEAMTEIVRQLPKADPAFNLAEMGLSPDEIGQKLN